MLNKMEVTEECYIYCNEKPMLGPSSRQTASTNESDRTETHHQL